MTHFQCLSFSELSLDQLYAVMALRQEVFVVEQDCPYLDADGSDQKGWHLLGENATGELVAYARLLPQGVTYEKYASIGRVVNAKSVRGQGLGQQLMQEAIAHYQRLLPNVPLKISAQCYLLKFYTNLGFNAVGEEYLEDGIPHIGMVYATSVNEH